MLWANDMKEEQSWVNDDVSSNTISLSNESSSSYCSSTKSSSFTSTFDRDSISSSVKISSLIISEAFSLIESSTTTISWLSSSSSSWGTSSFTSLSSWGTSSGRASNFSNSPFSSRFSTTSYTFLWVMVNSGTSSIKVVRVSFVSRGICTLLFL